MIQHPMCDCREDPSGMVKTTLPEGWQRMSERFAELLAVVECECGKVLKPPGVVWRNGRLMTLYR